METKFKKPTLEEVKEYLKEKNSTINPENFYYYYESLNWYRGKTKISNWKACVRTWEINNKKYNKEKFKNRTY